MAKPRESKELKPFHRRDLLGLPPLRRDLAPRKAHNHVAMAAITRAVIPTMTPTMMPIFRLDNDDDDEISDTGVGLVDCEVIEVAVLMDEDGATVELVALVTRQEVLVPVRT